MKRIAAFGSLLALAVSLNAAADLFLQLDGIPGESVSIGRRGWIDCQEFNFGASRTHSTVKASFQDVTLFKLLDKASPRLVLACAQGQALESAVLEIVRRNETGPIRVLQVKCSGVQVKSVDLSAMADGDRPQERVTLSYGAIQWTYTEIDSSGQSLKDILASWDLLSNSGGSGELPLDTDGDGMPDAYERLYGLNPLAHNADGDLDGDGMTNLEEYRAGTLPNSRDSVLRSTGSMVRPGVIALTWTVVPGKAYRLLGAGTVDGPYQFVRNLDTPASGSVGSVEIEATAAHRFFRVGLQ